MLDSNDYGEWAAAENERLTADYADAEQFDAAQYHHEMMVHEAQQNPFVRELLAAAREVLALGGPAASILRPAMSPLA